MLSYDISNMRSKAVGPAGVTPAREAAIRKRLDGVRKALRRAHADGSVGFLGIPERRKEAAAAERLAKDVAKRFKTLLVIGIGGSDLGARALIAALKKDGKGMDVRFAGANTDPDGLARTLAGLDLRTTAVNVISKSGDTIEPMSTFLYVRDRLIRTAGRKTHAAHVIATTDRERGTLRKIADKEGYRTLPVPEGIGGRYSALTPVGLFPAACAGIGSAGLLTGAEEARDIALGAPNAKNVALAFAGLHHEMYTKGGRNITVLMPYSDRLREFGQWFRQLWAESLGKRVDRAGRVVHRGLTPVASLGATDQHSQVQLYNEGPDDKVITFVEVGEFGERLTVPNPYPKDEGTAYMAGIPFDEIIHAERRATAHALAANGRPNGTITVPQVDAASVGALMMTFMAATAAMGELLDVNAYDQPGVEAGKKAMYALLGRKGYRVPGLRGRRT